MNAQESQLLNEFLERLVQVKGVAKDRDAEAMIARAVAQQPDAAYLLTQRALLQEQALEAAKQQISSLQNQLQERQGTNTSFLGSANAWGNSASERQNTLSAWPAQSSSFQSGSPPIQSAQGPSWLRGGTSSFLGTAAATAAGLAGGAFLFQGLENLLSHRSADSIDRQGAMDFSKQNAEVDGGQQNAGALSDNRLATASGVNDIESAGRFDYRDDEPAGIDGIRDASDTNDTDDLSSGDDSADDSNTI